MIAKMYETAGSISDRIYDITTKISKFDPNNYVP